MRPDDQLECINITNSTIKADSELCNEDSFDCSEDNVIIYSKTSGFKK